MKKITVIIISFLLAHMCFAQGFEAKLVGGINASQLEGDNLSGFDKLGIQVGLGVEYELLKNSISVELLFNQKGSAEKTSSQSTNRLSTTLNYVQIPILYNFNSWYNEKGFYQITVEGGPYISRLFGVTSTNPSIEVFKDNFKSFDFGLLLGVKYRFHRHLSIGIRYDQSLSEIYQLPNTQESALLSYLASLRMEYYF